MMWSEEDRSVVRRFGKPVAAACLVAALLGAAYLWHVRSNPTLSFRSLSVKNADGIQVTTRQVGAVVEKAVSGNFFTADLERVKEAVETLPWVLPHGAPRLSRPSHRGGGAAQGPCAL